MGGALSLYLGISLVMFLEIIEILPLMLLALLHKGLGIGRKFQAKPISRKRAPHPMEGEKFPVEVGWAAKS